MILSRHVNALPLSICTSSMIYTRYLQTAGV